MIRTIYAIIIFTCLGVCSCANKPEVIPASNTGSEERVGQSTGVFSSKDQVDSKASTAGEDVHEVTILDVLPTEKYVYLEVQEGDERFWIASRKQDVKKGQQYFFKGGLLKTNFESKEYNRTFDRVYLVSNLVPLNHGQHEDETTTSKDKNSIIKSIKFNSSKEGSIKISEILAHPDKYEGKSIQVTGECVKLNPNIMGRNWIHLKDGSNDDYDFVLTSSQAIPEGHVVTLSGVVSLNKDFGAGYRYDIIVEQAEIVN